jgi:hypothetical protein
MIQVSIKLHPTWLLVLLHAQVAMRALALHLWCPSGMKRPAGGAGSQAVVVKKEAPTAASEGAAPAAADSTDEDLPIAAKRRRRLNAPEPEPDLLPGLQPGGGSGVLGERAAGPQQAGMPGLPGLPSLAMPPAHTPADQGDQDSKSSVWRDTAAALTASAAMAAAAAAAAAGAPTPPMPAAAAAAAAAESGAARSGRTSRPIVTRLYSGTARAWVDMLRGSVETALAGGWGGDRPGPPSTLVAVAKGRVVQLEGQVWYFPLRYMQPRHNDSQLSVPVTLLQGLSAEGDAVVTHPVTLVPLVPRPAATALGVELEGPPVPSHVTNLLPFCQQWAAVAEIPTHTNCNKQLVGTKAGFDAFRPLTGWHMLCGYTVSAQASRARTACSCAAALDLPHAQQLQCSCIAFSALSLCDSHVATEHMPGMHHGRGRVRGVLHLAPCCVFYAHPQPQSSVVLSVCAAHLLATGCPVADRVCGHAATQRSSGEDKPAGGQGRSVHSGVPAPAELPGPGQPGHLPGPAHQGRHLGRWPPAHWSQQRHPATLTGAGGH